MRRKAGSMKKIICFSLVLILVLCSSSSYAWADGDNPVQIVDTSGQVVDGAGETVEESASETEESQMQEEENPASGDENSTEEESESTSESESQEENEGEDNDEGETEDETEESVDYDVQPTSIEEVQEAIDIYNAAFRTALEEGGTAAAMQVAKPRWEFEVEEELMPQGYRCVQVDGDPDFAAAYFTFFAMAVSASATWDGSIATSLSGSGTSEDPYLIKSAAELAYMAQQVNSGAGGYGTAEYKLMTDINLAGRAWMPIGIGGGIPSGANNTLDAETAIGADRLNYAFKGVFDGNGYTITGLTQFAARPIAAGSAGNVARGFFGAIESATIKNLTIDKANIEENGGATGILVGFAVNDVSGTGKDIYISNCSVTNSELKATMSTYQRLGVGALIGYMVVEDTDARAKVENCVVSDTKVVSRTTSFYGGIAAGIGYVRNVGTSSLNSMTNGQLEISGCSLINTTVNSRTNYSGGMVGYMNMHYNKGFTLEMNNINVQNLTLTRDSIDRYNFGGLLGYFNSNTSEGNKLVIQHVELSGMNVSSSNYTNPHTGGLVGQWYSANSTNDVCDISDITLSDITVTMTGSSSTGYIGGIIGEWYAYRSTNGVCNIKGVKASRLTFSTTGTSSGDIGGVIGQWYSYRDATSAAYNDDYHRFAIDDVRMDNLSISTAGGSSYSKGGIAGAFYTHWSGVCEGYIINCKVTNSSIYSSGTTSYNNGGVIGAAVVTSSKNSSFFIDNCQTDCELTNNGTNGYYKGGIAGAYLIVGTSVGHTSNFEGAITNCTASGDLLGVGSGNYYYGGIVGFLNQGTYSNGSYILVENCSATGDVITDSYYAGGMIGYIENTSDSGTRASNTQTVVRNCYATGYVSGGVNPDAPASGTNVGGFVGHAHAGTQLPSDTILIENCYATGDVIAAPVVASSGINAGGFVGRPSNNVTIRDCYSTGDVYASGIHAGGFVGYVEGTRSATADNHVTIENCYSTGNVVGGSYDVGGFVGDLQWGHLTNCYSIGSAHSTSSVLTYVGGFAGRIESAGGKLTNCYSSGHVSSATTNVQMGGFVGRVEAMTSANTGMEIYDCYFDTTTAGIMTSSGFNGTATNVTVYYNGVVQSDKTVRGITTSEMITADTFSAWNVVNNIYASSSKGVQTSYSPWYIDDNVTYPYLYFQADGFNTNKGADGYLDRSSTGDGYQNNIAITPYQTNYNLMVLYNSADNWNTSAAVAHKRADYTTSDLAGSAVQYNAVTGGAQRAYFTYVHPQNAANYNNKEYHWFFNGSGQVDIPSGGTYTHTAGTLYSLGSVSRTDIVAFENSAGTAKMSNRPKWNEGDSDTYTYVGEEYVYTIDVGNYSTNGAFKNVVVMDPLAAGVSMVEDTLQISWDGGQTYVDIPYDNSSGVTPYYTYELQTSGEYEGRYVLTIHLGDFRQAYYDNDTLIYDQCYIQYTAFIDREAATDFTDADWRSFENIRNRAYVSGTMVNENESIDITLIADDRNTDPVYYRYSVFYNDNLDDDNISDVADTEIHAGYYLTDGSQEHHVLYETDSLLAFSRNGYSFIGWATADGDGEIVQIYDPEDSFHVTEDTTLYAQWRKNESFEFYKVSAINDNIVLEGASFALYEYLGNGTPDGLVNVNTPGSDWAMAGSVITSGTDGKVVFEFPTLTDGAYYQLVETAAPANFKLPTGQWLIKVNSSLSSVTYEITKIDGADGAAPPAFKSVEENKLLLTNIPESGLPVMGGPGTAIYMLIGAMIIFMSTVFGIIKVSALRRKKHLRL